MQNFTESIENISQPGITTITIGYTSLNNKNKQQNNKKFFVKLFKNLDKTQIEH